MNPLRLEIEQARFRFAAGAVTQARAEAIARLTLGHLLAALPGLGEETLAPARLGDLGAVQVALSPDDLDEHLARRAAGELARLLGEALAHGARGDGR